MKTARRGATVPAPRRTQADRSAATRAKIVAAVVQCVDGLGLAQTTSQRIASAAGVTVGAVQHHFASKADILTAALEDSFERLSIAFDGAEVEGVSLEECVSVFVDRAWRHYGSAPGRSTLEIVRATRDTGDGSSSPGWADKPIEESSRRARALWNSFFGELPMSQRQHTDLLRFTFVTLSGMAMTSRLSGTQAQMQRQLEILKTALAALLHDAIERA